MPRREAGLQEGGLADGVAESRRPPSRQTDRAVARGVSRARKQASGLFSRRTRGPATRAGSATAGGGGASARRASAARRPAGHHLHRGPSRHRRGRDPGPARGQRRRECRVFLDPLAASHPPDAHVALVGETVPRTVSRSFSTLDGAGRHLSRALAVPPTITPASCRPRIGSGAGSTAQNSTRSSASGSPCASASSRCASCTRPRPSSTSGSRRLDALGRRTGSAQVALRLPLDREGRVIGPPYNTTVTFAFGAADDSGWLLPDDVVAIATTPRRRRGGGGRTGSAARSGGAAPRW